MGEPSTVLAVKDDSTLYYSRLVYPPPECERVDLYGEQRVQVRDESGRREEPGGPRGEPSLPRQQRRDHLS